MPWFLPDLKTPKNQAMDFEILNNPFGQHLVNKLEKIPPHFPAYPWVSQKRKRDLTI